MKRSTTNKAITPGEWAAFACLLESSLDPTPILVPTRAAPRVCSGEAAGNLSVCSVHLWAGFKHGKVVVELRVESATQVKRARV